MSYGNQTHRIAQALIEAEANGDEHAAKANGVTPRQLANWRARAMTSPEIQAEIASLKGTAIQPAPRGPLASLSAAEIGESIAKAKAFLDRSLGPQGLDPSKARDVLAVHETIGLLVNLQRVAEANQSAAVLLHAQIVGPDLLPEARSQEIHPNQEDENE